MASNTEKPLKFTFSPSSYEPSFWETIYDKKLNEYRLNSPRVPISTRISLANNKENATFHFSGESFDENVASLPVSKGIWYNTNTIEEFTGLDKKEFLNTLGDELILNNILSKEVLTDSRLLFGFGLATFADLKGYKFVYWFVLPTIIPFAPLHYKDYYLVKQERPALLEAIYSHLLASSTATAGQIFAVLHSSTSSSFPLRFLTFSEAFEMWQARLHQDPEGLTAGTEQLLWVVEDWSSTSSATGEGVVGWNLRNFLAFLSFHLSSPSSSSSSNASLEWNKQQVMQSAEVQIITLKNTTFFKHLHQQRSGSAAMYSAASDEEEHSAHYRIRLSLAHYLSPDYLSSLSTTSVTTSSSITATRWWQYVGWEPNDRGKAGARLADLSTTANPLAHYQQAIDLNLRLMKWRQWPDMQLDTLQQTRCLLLGMGTLGCAIARTLLGYGIQHMTLVDNGRVSYSNPNRQCLFDFADCINRGYKADCARSQLLRIVPHCVDSIQSVVLSIPMPGHPYTTSTSSTSAESGTDCLTDEAARHRLDQLIASHDVIFLLTDSREARWLPTVLARQYNKLLLNAALGFDTFLVMHHALPTTNNNTNSTSDSAAGCYFCQDIVAATNSAKHKALDEQCTVTRIGLSGLVSGLITELFVALLHAGNQSDDTEDNRPPHQIRGSVRTFAQAQFRTPAFPQCTACSVGVVAEYAARGADLVQAVCSEATLLEEISGLRALLAGVDVDDCLLEDDEDEDAM